MIMHITVGALFAIMFDKSMRNKVEAVMSGKTRDGSHPVLCGKTWGEVGNAINCNMIREDGIVWNSCKVTCKECIEVLKFNGL